MPGENTPVEWKNLPTTKIMQQIKEKLLDPNTLPKEVRQGIVESLLLQMTPIPKIALFLQTSDRTIQRDKQEIEQRNSRKPSLDYALELVAEFRRKSNAVQEQLLAMSKSEEKVQARAQAAFYLWKNIEEEMKMLQSLGYLPQQPLKIEAIVTQETGKDVAKLKGELAELEKIVNETGKTDDPTISSLIKSIKQDIALSEADNNLNELRKLVEPKKDIDEPNEPSQK